MGIDSSRFTTVGIDGFAPATIGIDGSSSVTVDIDGSSSVTVDIDGFAPARSLVCLALSLSVSNNTATRPDLSASVKSLCKEDLLPRNDNQRYNNEGLKLKSCHK
jgi:hypothetical protein